MRQWKINQTVAACIITFGGFSFGMGLSWTATALPSLEETSQVGSLTPAQKSWIASLFAVGALLACPVTGLYINELGRKASLLGFTALGFLGWLLLGSATDPLYIYFGRVLTGMSTGGYTIIVPIYVSEISSKENRGKLGSIFIVMLCLGKLFSNGVGISFSASTASYLCGLNSLVYATVLLFIPESPKYLLRKGKIEGAFDSLKWLETTGINVPYFCHWRSNSFQNQEISAKFQNVQLSQSKRLENTEKVSLKEFFTSRQLRLPSFIVFTQMLLSQFCGINVSTFYTVEIFEFAGDSIIDSKHATLLIAIVQTIGCLPCSAFVDKYGRKVLIVSAYITSAIAMLGLAAFFYMKAHTSLLEQFPFFGLAPVICLIIYNLAYSWGIGSVIWIVMAELLPPQIAGPTSAISNVLFWGGAFSITKGFQLFNTTVPMFVWFMSFSFVSAFGCCFNMIFLPETKGFTIQEIQTFFSKKNHQDQQKIEIITKF